MFELHNDPGNLVQLKLRPPLGCISQARFDIVLHSLSLVHLEPNWPFDKQSNTLPK